MQACPWCAEQIQDNARICRFCNRSVADNVEPPPLERSGNYNVPFRFDRQASTTVNAGGTSSYSAAGVAIAGNVCPACASPTYTSTYSLWHGVIALFTFPIGLLAFAFPIKRCAKCRQQYGAGLTMTRTLGIIAILFAVLVLLAVLGVAASVSR